MRLTGALATHYHPDHVGGSMMGHTIAGVAELLTHAPVPIHVQADEVPWVLRTTGLSDTDLAAHPCGHPVMLGELPIVLINTPGPPPGPRCFLLHNCGGSAITPLSHAT